MSSYRASSYLERSGTKTEAAQRGRSRARSFGQMSRVRQALEILEKSPAVGCFSPKNPAGRAFGIQKVLVFQDVGKGGLSLRGVAFMTVWRFWRFWRFWRAPCLYCACPTKNSTMRQPWRFRRSWRFHSWRLPPLNSTPLFRHPDFSR